MVPNLAGDALRLVKERPAVVIGAGVVALLAVRFLGGDEVPAEPAPAGEPVPGDGTFGLGYGPGLGGTGLYGSGGTIDYGYGSGDFYPPLPVPAPAPAPMPTPPPPSTPPPAAAPWWPSYLGTPPSGATFAIAVPAGTYWLLDSAGRHVRKITTGGFSAFGDSLRVVGGRQIGRLRTGALAGSWVPTSIGRLWLRK